MLVHPSDFVAGLLPRIEGRPLTIHSRFTRSINLLLSPTILLTLTSPALGLSPFGLAAERDLTDRLPELARAGQLHFQNGYLWAAGCPLFQIAPTPPYPTSLAVAAPGPQIEAATFHRLLISLLPAHPQGLAELLPLWPWQPYQGPDQGDVQQDIFSWVRAAHPTVSLVAQCSSDELIGAADRLIGLGIGLTPSGDDFLIGFIAGRLAQGETGEIRGLRKGLAKPIMAGTNLISASYLRHALQGRFSSHLRELLALIHQPGATLEQLRPAVEQVLTIGSTSGWDSLVGLLAALQRHEKRAEPGSGR